MRVLLTGAFGNIGKSTIEELVNQGHTVSCFDLKTAANERTAQRFERTLGDQVRVCWGDLCRPGEVADVVRGQEVVVHLAFIIPKMSATGIESESEPEWARQINVGGTLNLLSAMKALPEPPKILFISSYHVYGRTQDQPPPRTLSDPVRPEEHYSYHKLACEQMVQSSGLEWTIFRLAAAMPFAIQLDPGMFDVPLDNRMEFVHSRDVGLAIANAIGSEDAWGKILLIGGGPRCQYYFREIVERILGAVGVGMLPDEAFSTTPFCTDWIDTTESQKLLHYQQRDLEDYVSEMKQVLGFRRTLARAFRPWVRRALLKKSPYYGRSQTVEAPPIESSTADQEASPSTGKMELTPEVRSLLLETARSLTGRARRMFMGRTVKALGQDGAQEAERELGWTRKTILLGIKELEKARI